MIGQCTTAAPPGAYPVPAYNLERSTFLWKEGSKTAKDLKIKQDIFFFILGALSDPVVTMDAEEGAPIGLGCLDVKGIKGTKQLLLAPMSEQKGYSLEYMAIAKPDNDVYKLAYKFAAQIVHNISIFDADGNGEPPHTSL